MLKHSQESGKGYVGMIEPCGRQLTVLTRATHTSLLNYIICLSGWNS